MEYANSDGYAAYLSNRLDWEILNEELCVCEFKDSTKEEKHQIKKNRKLADKLINFCINHFNDYNPKFQLTSKFIYSKTFYWHMEMKPVVIGASWFQEASFCEQKLYLSKVKKLPLVETEAMAKGALIHKEKYEDFAKSAEPTTWEEFFKSEQLVTSREVELQHISNNVVLLGRIDELSCDRDGIYITDDKPNDYAYIGVRKQIWAYCHLLENNFQNLIQKPIYAVLKNRDNGEIVWKEKYAGAHKEQFLLAMLRLRDVLSKNRKPEPTKNPNKCRVCQYNKVCEFSLAK